MRRLVCLAAVLALVWCGNSPADDQADMKALVNKAIKAAGGAAKLAMFKGITFKEKGIYYGMGQGVEYTGEWSEQQPDKMRMQIDVTAGNMKITFIRVVNGDKVWAKTGGEATAIDNKDQIAEAREECYVGWISSLLPLKNKAFQLSPLGEVKVDGKPAVGVRVSHKGHRDINLFFDKESGLLAKRESVIKDFMADGKEATQETLFSNYKEVKGAKFPMKVVLNRDGKKYVESEMTEIEPKEKIDDAVFGKP